MINCEVNEAFGGAELSGDVSPDRRFLMTETIESLPRPDKNVPRLRILKLRVLQLHGACLRGKMFGDQKDVVNLRVPRHGRACPGRAMFAWKTSLHGGKLHGGEEPTYLATFWFPNTLRPGQARSWANKAQHQDLRVRLQSLDFFLRTACVGGLTAFALLRDFT